MNRAVLDRAVLGCANISIADVGNVGVMGAYDDTEVKPYISGHVTDGSSTFTFKINGNNITVPVGSDGKWKWVQDRDITSFFDSFYVKQNIDELYIMCDISKITTFYRAFYNNTSLKKLVFSKKYTNNIATQFNNFVHFSQLTELDLSMFGMEGATSTWSMFNTTPLKTIDLSNANFKSLTTVDNMFWKTYELENLLLKPNSIKNSLLFAESSKLTEQSVVNIFNAVADDITLTFHQNVWNMIMREIDVQGSPIQVAYQNMIDNYDVTIANASFDAEIEYIEGTGTQWIDTNIKFKPTTVFETRFMEINIPENPSNRTHIIGTHQGNTRYRLRRLEPDVLYFLYGSNGSDWNTGFSIKEKTVDIYFSTTILKYKNGNNWVEKDISNTEQFIESPDTITLFYAKNLNNIDTKFEGRFYYLKIWDNGNLVADFIPVRKGTTGYMYDKVSGDLFGNSGTGDFILGNDK